MILKRSSSNSPKLFTIIEELKDGFCTINRNGEFIYLNLAANEMLQIEDDKNQNFFTEIIRDKNTINYLHEFLNENSYIKDFEIELYTQADKKIPALISINMIKDPGNNVIGMSVLIKDMTYIKQVQQQLLQAQKMESIGMLASGVAHEFNNILTGILPNAELIKMTTPANEANYLRADSIQKSATRASEIVKKLLNFARNDSIQKKQSTDFIKTAHETIDILKRLFDRRVELDFRHGNDIYNATIDGTSIQQILMNLAINAKDAISGDGKIIFTVQNFDVTDVNNLSGKKLLPGKYLKFQVRDTGQGIEKHRLKFIFDPFYTTKDLGKGTGLGLSMVYGILKSCNGLIEVDSEIGVGTVFTVYIPATERVERNEVSEFHQSQIGHGRTILVIDDEEIISEMATDMLQAMGFTVHTAENGVEGLDVYRSKGMKIDVVLLDLLMPEMDGITCYTNLKLINPEVKVVISSGIGEDQKKEELMNMGVNGYLEKPYSMKSISRTLENIL